VSGLVGGDRQWAEDIARETLVNCREIQEETAVGLLTAGDFDEPTGQHIATCAACAAEQASLRQVCSFRDPAR
jgi:hypothetical protein